MVLSGLLTPIDGTAKGRRLVALRASTMAFGAQNLKAVSLCEDVRYHNDLGVREGGGRRCDPVDEPKTQ